MAKRLFVGLELPANTRALLAKLDPKIRGVGWTAVEQMHLTLSFSAGSSLRVSPS